MCVVGKDGHQGGGGKANMSEGKGEGEWEAVIQVCLADMLTRLSTVARPSGANGRWWR